MSKMGESDPSGGGSPSMIGKELDLLIESLNNFTVSDPEPNVNELDELLANLSASIKIGVDVAEPQAGRKAGGADDERTSAADSRTVDSQDGSLRERGNLKNSLESSSSKKTESAADSRSSGRKKGSKGTAQAGRSSTSGTKTRRSEPGPPPGRMVEQAPDSSSSSSNVKSKQNRNLPVGAKSAAEQAQYHDFMKDELSDLIYCLDHNNANAPKKNSSSHHGEAVHLPPPGTLLQTAKERPSILSEEANNSLDAQTTHRLAEGRRPRDASPLEDGKPRDESGALSSSLASDEDVKLGRTDENLLVKEEEPFRATATNKKDAPIVAPDDSGGSESSTNSGAIDATPRVIWALPLSDVDSQLDSMLQSFQVEMSTLQNEDQSLGICQTCHKPIFSNLIQALGLAYHVEHFVCSMCGKLLDQKTFYSDRGAPCCKGCSTWAICPKCVVCQQPITERIIGAFNQQWHADCFKCQKCQTVLAGNFFDFNNAPYCESCYTKQVSPRCKACGEIILGNYLSAMNAQWHEDHFVCCVCGVKLESHYEKNGRPYCQKHFSSEIGIICAFCSEPVTDTHIEAFGKKWHPEHFNCTFCSTSLVGKAYFEKKGKPYCGACTNKLFGT